jgi:hypothetical protein
MNLNSVRFPGLDGEYKIPQTAEDVGAAPAGYGLGEKVGRYCADCYSGTQLGLYYVDGNTANMPNGATGGVLLVEGKSTTYNYGVDFYLTLKSGVQIWHCYYSSWAGQWQPWECENPPMELGKEYCTTERWNGKAVYAKAIDCGALPNATTKVVAWTPNSGSCTSVIGYGGTTIGYGALPNTIAGIELSVNTANIMIKTNADRSSGTAVVWVKYTKD